MIMTNYDNEPNNFQQKLQKSSELKPAPDEMER